MDLSRRAFLFGRGPEPVVPEAPRRGLLDRIRELFAGPPDDGGGSASAADGTTPGLDERIDFSDENEGSSVVAPHRPDDPDLAASGDRASPALDARRAGGEVAIPPEIAERAARFRAEMAARPRKRPDAPAAEAPAGPAEAPPDGAPDAPAPEIAAAGAVNWLAPERHAPHPGVPLLRPPGAVDEAAFLAKCTRCGDCAPACPYGAITFVHPRVPGAAGTPIIDPALEACRMCPDMPCAKACGPGVLRPDRGVKMGTAQIQTFSCLNTLGGFCSVCVERCPVPGAIRLDGRRVVVEADTCTGCGMCAYACPAPGTAIVMLPATERPDWTERSDP